MPWRIVAAAVAAGGAAVVTAVLALGARSWNRATARAVEQLGRAASSRPPGPDAKPTRYDPAQLTGLPSPVIRYFTLALTPGQPLLRRVRLTHEGTFARERDRWVPFTSTEDFSVSPPGFVWDARIRMAPLAVAYVRDSYVAGEGVMHAAVAGLATVVDQRGTPELASGALLRYLAEAAWFPTALLPSEGVRWEPVDDFTARATLCDSGITVSMDAHFAPGGELERVSAVRYRDVKGTPVLTPWVGRFSSYARVDGMMVPTEGEVGWLLPDGWAPYWRGRTVTTEILAPHVR